MLSLGPHSHVLEGEKRLQVSEPPSASNWNRPIRPPTAMSPA